MIPVPWSIYREIPGNSWKSLLACEISSCVTSGCWFFGSGRHLSRPSSSCLVGGLNHPTEKKKRVKLDQFQGRFKVKITKK